jgi:hypothetical protein
MEQTTNKTEQTSATVIALPASHIETPPYTFSPRELARLRIYRAAVIVGFYTDH